MCYKCAYEYLDGYVQGLEHFNKISMQSSYNIRDNAKLISKKVH